VIVLDTRLLVYAIDTEPAVVDSVFASVPRLPHVLPGTEEFERLLRP
jgi:hypothetical protein